MAALIGPIRNERLFLECTVIHVTLALVSQALRHVWGGGIPTNCCSTLRSDDVDTMVHGAIKSSTAPFSTYLSKIK